MATLGAWLALCVFAWPAHAEGGERHGSATFERARAAWNRGEFDAAETMLVDALTQGGLDREDTLSAYVYLGAASAVMGKKSSATRAFRAAARMDPNFEVPPEAGKKAASIAKAAKRKERRHKPVKIELDAPDEVDPKKSFTVKVTTTSTPDDELRRIGLRAKADGAASPYVFDREVAPKTRFNVPKKFVLAGRTIHLKVLGLDENDNALALGSKDVRVTGDREDEPVAFHGSRPGEPPDGDHGPKKKGGFWSSPWPYVIGGALLAGGAVAAYFATQEQEGVAFAPVTVQTGP